MALSLADPATELRKLNNPPRELHHWETRNSATTGNYNGRLPEWQPARQPGQPKRAPDSAFNSRFNSQIAGAGHC